MIQKINENQHIIQPKLMSNAKQTKMRRIRIKVSKKIASNSPAATPFLFSPSSSFTLKIPIFLFFFFLFVAAGAIFPGKPLPPFAVHHISSMASLPSSAWPAGHHVLLHIQFGFLQQQRAPHPPPYPRCRQLLQVARHHPCLCSLKGIYNNILHHLS